MSSANNFSVRVMAGGWHRPHKGERELRLQMKAKYLISDVLSGSDPSRSPFYQANAIGAKNQGCVAGGPGWGWLIFCNRAFIWSSSVWIWFNLASISARFATSAWSCALSAASVLIWAVKLLLNAEFASWTVLLMLSSICFSWAVMASAICDAQKYAVSVWLV